jgi:hypothetical protein
MPSRQSIWIDEAQTWNYACLEHFGDIIAQLQTDKYSEAQMPLGMASAWMGVRMFGTSEWGFRAINIIWVGGAVIALFIVGRILALSLLPLIFAIHPFVWFYADEARPYAMQLFGGTLLLLSLALVYSGRKEGVGWVVVWLIGALITSGASMLGVIPSGIVAVANLMPFLPPHRTSLRKSQILVAVLGMFPLAALGAYYTTTLLRGSGGAKIWELGTANIAFAAMEFSGFQGLLPPRQILREIAKGGGLPEMPLSSLAPLVGVPVLLICFCFLLYGFYKAKNRTPKAIAPIFISTLAIFVCLCSLALAARFPFWGRHLAPAFPLFITAVCWCGKVTWEENRPNSRGVIILGFITLMFSTALFRFTPIHAKDDYRSACRVAKAALDQGKVVWWAADGSAPKYYGTIPHAGPGQIIMVKDKTGGQLESLPPPQMIFLSKPDVYDGHSAIRRVISAGNMKQSASFTAFTVWIP